MARPGRASTPEGRRRYGTIVGVQKKSEMVIGSSQPHRGGKEQILEVMVFLVE